MRPRYKSLLACFIGVVVAVPALAQSGASVTTYAACPDPPPKLSQVELDAARASWRVANEAYAKGDYQKALTNLKDAFSRDCSRVELLTQIALIYELLGNRQEALHALETYIQRNPKAQDADTIKDKIQKLQAMLGSSASTTAPNASASGTAPAETATAPVATAAPSVTASPSSTATPAGDGGHTAGPWVVVVSGAVAAIGGGVLVGIGQGDVSHSRQDCTSNGGSLTCLPPLKTADGQDRQSLNSRGTTMTNVGLIVGSVGLAAVIGGLVWHFLEPKHASAALAPVVAPGYAGLSLGGNF